MKRDHWGNALLIIALVAIAAACALGALLGCTSVENGAGKLLGEAEVADPTLVRYPVKPYHAQVDARLWRSSRIDDAAAYRRLFEEGFPATAEGPASGPISCLVDFRKEGKGDCALGACQAGLTVLRLPVIDNTPPTEEQARAFVAFVQGCPGLTVGHCEAGQGRTGDFMAFWRVAVQGWTPAAALEEAERYGLRIPSQRAWILSIRP